MRTIRKTLQKEGYQQYWFLNNIVELHREIEAVPLSRLEHRANNAKVESSSLSMATFCSVFGKMRKVKETFARCVPLEKHCKKRDFNKNSF